MPKLISEIERGQYFKIIGDPTIYLRTGELQYTKVTKIGKIKKLAVNAVIIDGVNADERGAVTYITADEFCIVVRPAKRRKVSAIVPSIN